MKKLLILFAILSTIFACDDPSEEIQLNQSDITVEFEHSYPSNYDVIILFRLSKGEITETTEYKTSESKWTKTIPVKKGYTLMVSSHIYIKSKDDNVGVSKLKLIKNGAVVSSDECDTGCVPHATFKFE